MASGSPRQPRGKQPKGTFLGRARRRRVVTRAAGCWRSRWFGACRVLGQPRPRPALPCPLAGQPGRRLGSRELWGWPRALAGTATGRVAALPPGRDEARHTRQPLPAAGVAQHAPGPPSAPPQPHRGAVRHPQVFSAHPCAGNAPRASPTRPRRPGLAASVPVPSSPRPTSPRKGTATAKEGSNSKPQRPAAQTTRSSPPPRKPRPPVEDSRHTHNPAPPHKPAQVPSTPTRNHHTNTHPAPNPPTNNNPKQHPHHHTNTRAGQCPPNRRRSAGKVGPLSVISLAGTSVRARAHW